MDRQTFIVVKTAVVSYIGEMEKTAAKEKDPTVPVTVGMLGGMGAGAGVAGLQHRSQVKKGLKLIDRVAAQYPPHMQSAVRTLGRIKMEPARRASILRKLGLYGGLGGALGVGVGGLVHALRSGKKRK